MRTCRNIFGDGYCKTKSLFFFGCIRCLRHIFQGEKGQPCVLSGALLKLINEILFCGVRIINTVKPIKSAWIGIVDIVIKIKDLLGFGLFVILQKNNTRHRLIIGKSLCFKKNGVTANNNGRSFIRKADHQPTGKKPLIGDNAIDRLGRLGIGQIHRFRAGKTHRLNHILTIHCARSFLVSGLVIGLYEVIGWFLGNLQGSRIAQLLENKRRK